ncbi:hypothetical protein BDY19DRAFT_959178 [Irpex rosettiformis]|uniref:Uncharacterized protein n=1 Tax=Irpex rosettiformis TaxID=378272 RepID=A0ACB8TY37_9APHY|nr:hypothetical protein BDY19DRAFT_959178 [Irpex rosettiformis]
MSEPIHAPTAVHSKSDLPPSRGRKGLRPVSPPLSNVPMHRFSYYMAFAAALLLGIYAWRVSVWKAEAGGWWNLFLGRHPSGSSGSSRPIAEGGIFQGTGGSPPHIPTNGAEVSGDGNKEVTVEERINELASALGVPTMDLARAIADAVREYVPPASLSSISTHQTGSAVEFLVGKATGTAQSLEQEGAGQATVVAERGFKVAAKAFEAVVGMEEPPSELS